MSTENPPEDDSDVEVADEDDPSVVKPSLEGLSDGEKQALAVLEENAGLFLTAEIVKTLTDYSEGHIRNCLHNLADDGETDVARERRSKEIYGVLVGGNFVVITNDKDQLLEVVKTFSPSDLASAKAMTTDELRSFVIEEVADTEVTSTTDKLYFGIPE